MRLRKQACLILVVVLSLAACDVFRGQTAGTSSPGTLESDGIAGAESSPIPATPVNSALTPAPPGTVTLQIWIPPEFDPNSGTPAGDLLQMRLQDFMAQNPGVTIEVRLKAVDGSGGLLESLVTASAAAPLALPDLVALPRPLLESAALKGLVYPYAAPPISPEGEDWYSYARQMAYLQAVPYGLPFAGDALVMVYRTTSMRPPLNWQEVLSGNRVLVFPAADPNASMTLALYLAEGGQLQDSQGRPMLSQTALLSVLGYYQGAAQANLMPFWLTQSETDDQAWEIFEVEEHPMLVTWISRYLAEDRSAPVSLSLAPLPTQNGEPFTLASGWTWALASPDPARREMSARLAEFLVAEDFLALWTQAAGYMPTRPAALAGWNDSTLRSMTERIAASAQLTPPTELLASLGPVLRQAVVDVLKEESTPQEAVQAALSQLSAP
jgi:ABC-type glycerol-3-phosphate transport system substrate-binding protein